jgi:mRNA degradation ribonuclease J1/J2
VGVYENAERQNISLAKNLKEEIDNAPQRKRASDEGLKEFVQKTLKRIIRSEYGKKPIITIHLVRN